MNTNSEFIICKNTTTH